MKKKTELGKSYWSENAAYSKEYSELWDKLVPSQGEADTIHGELIRCGARLTYDYYNNGNCNVIEELYETEEHYTSCCVCGGSGEIDCDEEELETCDECFGSGEETWEDEVYIGREIKDYYLDMIIFLREHLEYSEVVDHLEEFLMDGSLGYSEYKYTSKEESVYVNLMDTIMYQVVTTENKSREIKETV